MITYRLILTMMQICNVVKVKLIKVNQYISCLLICKGYGSNSPGSISKDAGTGILGLTDT